MEYNIFIGGLTLSKIVKQRIGRLNTTQFFTDGTVKKISRVKEKNRISRLQLEWWALKEAKERGVNVPETMNYLLDNKGREILELREIKGKNLTRTVSPENLRAFQSVGEQMRRLKGGFEGFGFLNPNTMQGIYKDWHVFLNSFFEIYGGNLVRNGTLASMAVNQVKESLEKSNFTINEPYLLHRDIKPGNLMRDKEGNIWIIDWENIILGDLLLDLAQFGANYGHTALWNNLARGYGFMEDVLTLKYSLYEAIILTGIIDFCQKYNIPWKRRLQNLKRILEGID